MGHSEKLKLPGANAEITRAKAETLKSGKRKARDHGPLTTDHSKTLKS
jgi:hypothetical protein